MLVNYRILKLPRILLQRLQYFRIVVLKKYTWISPDHIIHKQINHVLIEKRTHLSVIDIRSLRGANCDTDHYLVIVSI